MYFYIRTHKLYEMAKSLKNDDAKLKGLMLQCSDVSQFPNTSRDTPSIYVQQKEESNVLRVFVKARYSLHYFLKNYNEVLSNDALNEELKSKFRIKASYHDQKASSLLSKL